MAPPLHGWHNSESLPLLTLPPCPLQALEGLLHGMGVKHIVVPAMKGVLPMWEAHFGYSQFT